MVVRAMSWFRVGLASVVACLLLAAPAGAQSGNGLYEPFPSAAPRERAERFVERLDARPVSDEEFERGTFTGAGLEPASAGAASARAEATTGASSAALWAVALAILAACAAPALHKAARARG
jgi:hypothetical protein